MDAIKYRNAIEGVWLGELFPLLGEIQKLDEPIDYSVIHLVCENILAGVIPSFSFSSLPMREVNVRNHLIGTVYGLWFAGLFLFVPGPDVDFDTIGLLEITHFSLQRIEFVCKYFEEERTSLEMQLCQNEHFEWPFEGAIVFRDSKNNYSGELTHFDAGNLLGWLIDLLDCALCVYQYMAGWIDYYSFNL